ncbi:MAG: AMP-binding protein, partial [Deltaproteobacteria bacterium]|nr:AMP-binding protein [Deltaproteobacteria bacterium]
DGYLYIIDRLKDMIITGGENVYSLEVEEALYTYPDVQECAVIGAPDKEWGERVMAFIIPRPNRSIDDKKLQCFLKSRLSPYKVPKLFFTVSDFPRNPAGKVLKRELRKTAIKKND